MKILAGFFSNLGWGDRKCLVAEEAFDDILERLDGGFDIWGVSWFGNFGVELGSSGGGGVFW